MAISSRAYLGAPAGDTGHGAKVVACLDCDAIQLVDRGPGRLRSVCFRCGGPLARHEESPPGDGSRRALACLLAAIPLFIAAQVFPLVRLDGHGQRVAVTVCGGVAALYRQNLAPLAVLVLLTTVAFPAARILGGVCVLLWRRQGKTPAVASAIARVLEVLRPWNQIEILLFGLLVAFAKLSSIFHMAPGLGLPCLAAVLVLDIMARRSMHAGQAAAQARQRSVGVGVARSAARVSVIRSVSMAVSR